MTTMDSWGANRGARGPSRAFLLIPWALLSALPARGRSPSVTTCRRTSAIRVRLLSRRPSD